MCQSVQANQQAQRREEDLQRQEQAQVRDQLNRLQDWDLQGMTVEERRTERTQQIIQQQREENELLGVRVQRLFPEAQADQAAPGAPEQTLAPAQDSYKRRREISNGTKKARKKTPVGDHVTYAINQQLAVRAKEVAAVQKGRWREDAQARGVDPEAMAGFLLGHKSGWFVDNSQRDREDQTFIEEYTSKDLQRRKPYLEHFTNQVLNFTITSDMFTDEYLERHADELIAMHQQMNSLQRMIIDPINRGYFERELPSTVRDMLAARMTQRVALGALIQNRLAAKGLNADGSYNPDGAAAAAAQQSFQRCMDNFNQTVQDEKQLRDQRMERRLGKTRAALRQQADWNSRLIQADPRFAGLNLKSYLVDYKTDYRLNVLADLRDAIAAAPQQYAAKKGVLDQLYQKLYQTLDAMGDAQLEEQALTHWDKTRADSEIHQLLPAAWERVERLDEVMAAFRRQVEMFQSLIRFFLNGEPLTEAAQRYIQREGLEDEPEDEEAVQVQQKVDALVFSEHPQKESGIPLTSFMVNNQGDTVKFVLGKQRKGLREQFNARFSDVKKYGKAFTGYLTSPTGNEAMFRMNMSRTATALEGALGEGMTIEEVAELYEKLLCGGRYQYLKGLPQQSRTKEEQEELDGYTEQRLQEMEQRFEEGVQQIRELFRAQMNRFKDKYGRYIGQLHPEDFCSKIGKEYFDEILFFQDLGYMLEKAPQYFDFENSEEDQQLRDMYAYFHNAVVTQAMYFGTLQGFQQVHGEEAEAVRQQFPAAMQNMDGFWKEVMEREVQVDGPGLTRTEQRAYLRSLEKRFAEKESYRLGWGRFAPENP